MFTITKQDYSLIISVIKRPQSMKYYTQKDKNGVCGTQQLSRLLLAANIESFQLQAPYRRQ